MHHASCIKHHAWPKEDNLKNEDDLKNEVDLKNEDDVKNKDNIKNENYLKKKDNLKKQIGPPLHLDSHGTTENGNVIRCHNRK